LGFDASPHSVKLPSSIKSSNRGVLIALLCHGCKCCPRHAPRRLINPPNRHPASQMRILCKPATQGGHRGECRDCCGLAGQPHFRLGGRQRLPSLADTGRAWRRMPRACPARLSGNNGKRIGYMV
jgi:hypothetical protein